MNRIIFLGRMIALLIVPSGWGETPSAPADTILAAVNGFHDALHRGDAKAAIEWLAQDAVILESGGAETREVYERHHLAEDIAFSREVETNSSTPDIHLEGNVAWVSSTSRVTGLFNGREVNSAGAELVVLTNSGAGWRIRAIHWSSHKLSKAE